MLQTLLAFSNITLYTDLPTQKYLLSKPKMGYIFYYGTLFTYVIKNKSLFIKEKLKVIYLKKSSVNFFNFLVCCSPDAVVPPCQKSEGCYFF